MCAPSSPDTTRQDDIALRMQNMSESQWQWVQQQWEEDEPNREAAIETAQQVSAQQLEMMERSGELAEESANHWRSVYRPLEVQAAREAENFDSEARQAKAAGEAVAGVRQQSGIERGVMERSLASMGVNASDGAYAAMQGELRNQTSLNAATSANSARDRVQTIGRALRADAIGVGRGVVSAQGSQTGTALSAGANSIQSATAPSAINQGSAAAVSAGMGQAMNGLQGASNIYQNSSNAHFQADQAAASNNAQLAGAAVTAAVVF